MSLSFSFFFFSISFFHFYLLSLSFRFIGPDDIVQRTCHMSARVCVYVCTCVRALTARLQYTRYKKISAYLFHNSRIVSLSFQSFLFLECFSRRYIYIHVKSSSTSSDYVRDRWSHIIYVHARYLILFIERAHEDEYN